MVRIRDGRLNGALAITPVYHVVLTPGVPPRLALLSLQGFLQGQKIPCTTNRLHLYLRLDVTMYPFIHLVAIALRIIASASASSDDFYDFYVVYSDSVLDSDLGYSTFMTKLFEKSLPPVHFVNLNGFLRTGDSIGAPIPYVYFNYVQCDLV